MEHVEFGSEHAVEYLLQSVHAIEPSGGIEHEASVRVSGVIFDLQW